MSSFLASGAKSAMRAAPLSCALALATLLFGASQALASESPPTIDGISVTNVGESATIEAQINPHDGTTLYELRLVWQDSQPPSWGEPLPGGVQSTGVQSIPPRLEDVPVRFALKSLHSGYSYWYLVRAGNRAGEINGDGQTLRWFAFGNSAVYPEGWTPPNKPYEPLGPFWNIFSAEEAAARAVRESHEAQVREQQEAAEAARLAEARAAAKRHEEELQQAPLRKKSAAHCLVPSLRGDTLSAARRVLTRHHCRLGKVRWPAHRHGTFIVIAQSPRHGRKLAHSAPVAVTLGANERH